MDAIINEHAGGRGPEAGKRLREALPHLFKEAGLDANIHWVTPPEVPALVERLLDSGARRLIVGGGDGTLNATANLLAGTDTALGVLPLGTLNHFAKDLGLPAELEAAVAVLAGAGRRPWMSARSTAGFSSTTHRSAFMFM